jgi:dipeptidyl aminopeptidase/acylaminoacyl peptidase
VIFAPSPADNDRGQLLFLRDNVLYAQPFDASTLSTTGDASPLISSIAAGAPGQGEAGRSNRGFFSTSSNGVLVFRPGSAGRQQLTWLSRMGAPLGTVGEAGGYSEIDLSPDGRRLAAVHSRDIWIIDLDRNVTNRFTLDGANNRSPVWSRDGSHIAFQGDRDGRGVIFVKPAGGGSQELLFSGDEQGSPTDFTSDNQALVFTSTRKTGTDVLLLPLAGGFKPNPPVRALAHTQFQEGQGKISPDGRWMVYASGESGRNEAYVRPFPTGDTKWLVSKGTGVEYRWRADSGELYYRSGNALMSVQTKSGTTFQPGEPKELFQAPIVGAGGFNRNPSYVVTPDGQKFLAVLAPTENLSDAMTVVLNWQAGLKK